MQTMQQFFALFSHPISASKRYSELYNSNTLFYTNAAIPAYQASKCRVLRCTINPTEKYSLILYATHNHKGWIPRTEPEYH